MTRGSLSVALADEAATQRLGEDLALMLRRGDCLALSGDLGAGKSTLARALIRALADDPHYEVPSPTFTLVQSYDLPLPVAHFDFYRLSDAGEVDELGLDEALDHGIALVEWPERAEGALPDDAIRLTLSEDGSGRIATVSANALRLTRLKRVLAGRAFLDRAGYGAALRRPLTGDASARAYETVTRAGAPRRILMDWPPVPPGPALEDGLPYTALAHIATGLLPFRALSQMLLDRGFVAPRVLAADEEAGFALLDDLGAGSILDPHGRPLPERAIAAAECLAALHDQPVPETIRLEDGRTYVVPPFDRRAMKIETRLLLDWYMPGLLGRTPDENDRAEFAAIWDGLIDAMADGEKHLLIRDFHSPNIIWQPGEAGVRRVGIIDFQDAMIGPTAYDLASLVHDARVDIDPALRSEMRAAYLAARGPRLDRDRFERDFAVMAAQRATKLLGLWVRLDRRDGKPAYMRHMPRSRAMLLAALDHPALAPLKEWCVKSAIFRD